MYREYLKKQGMSKMKKENLYIRVLEQLPSENYFKYEVSFFFLKENFKEQLNLIKTYEMYPTGVFYCKEQLNINSDYSASVDFRELYYQDSYMLTQTGILELDENFALISDIIETSKEVKYENKLIPLEVRVYNVGQGNMNTIHYEDGSVTLYDQGSINKKILLSKKKPMNLLYDDINTLFISHFHRDHYNLIVPLNFKSLQSIFVSNDFIPSDIYEMLVELKKNNPTAIIYSLNLSSVSGKVTLHFDNQFLQIYTGNNSKPSNINDKSIVLNIHKKYWQICSFTGDISWDLYAQTLTWKCDCELSIVVPHHGGDIGNFFPPNPPKINHSCINAVYSHGNKYGHPLDKTRDIINNYKFNELETVYIDLYDYYKI